MTNKVGLSIKELLQDKRAEIIAIAEKHGAYNVRLFGSVAREEATEDSDIDFLVDYNPDKRSSWFPAGLVLDLESLLTRKVDVATTSMLKGTIKERVLREAILL